MRLKREYIIGIKKMAREIFGKGTRVYLFGSRADDSRKGGDIDLYVETDLKENVFERKLEFLGKLQDMMGEQKIDVVINNFTYRKYIYQVAKDEGVLL